MKVSFAFLAVLFVAVCVLGSTASEIEEKLVRVARADKPPYLPRPTPPRPNYARIKRDTCVTSVCRTYCKSKHPAYSGVCINGQCDCS